MYNGHQLIKISTQHCWCWCGWWCHNFAAKCKAFATGVTTHHIWPNLQTVRLRVQKYLCFLFPKVRSPSSGSLQKLQSGNNRCPELRSLTWKETKHVHYYFHRNLRGDRIGNQNTLKVSFYLPPESKQSLLHIRSLELPKIFIDGSFWGAWAKSHPSSLLTLAVASEVICNWYYFKLQTIYKFCFFFAKETTSGRECAAHLDR